MLTVSQSKLFLARRASLRAGEIYKRRVCDKLRELFPGKVSEQVPCNGGYADAVIDLDRHQVVVEVKAQLTLAAFSQCKRYAEGLDHPAQLVICKRCDPVAIPTRTLVLRSFRDIPSLEPHHVAVLPWSGRFA